MFIRFTYKNIESYFQGLKYICLCRDDYLKMTNEKGQAFGVFCQDKTGKAVLVTGAFVFIKLHSDFLLEKRGFRLLFTLVPLGR